MDLTGWLLRIGAARPHVLLVTAVGGTAGRLAVESELLRRGWPQAQSPADADVLVMAGEPGPQLAEVVEALWRQVPAPRARVQVIDAAAAALDEAVAVLADAAGQGEEPDRAVVRKRGDSRGSTGHGEHGGHGDMAMPGGLPMADLGEDRDGLTLDRVHVPLGPALPDWPAGLVVRVTLQGDVVQEAQARILDAPHPAEAFWDRPDRAAGRELDALAGFLGAAGWGDAADHARRLRDGLLAGTPPSEPDIGKLVRRVRGSWVLRRLVRGVRAGSTDVLALLEQRLAAVERAVAGSAAPRDPGQDTTELARMLVGAEFAALRLIVAVLGPDIASTGAGPHAEPAERAATP